MWNETKTEAENLLEAVHTDLASVVKVLEGPRDFAALLEPLASLQYDLAKLQMTLGADMQFIEALQMRVMVKMQESVRHLEGRGVGFADEVRDQIEQRKEQFTQVFDRIGDMITAEDAKVAG